jgi:hypothetical protein
LQHLAYFALDVQEVALEMQKEVYFRAPAKRNLNPEEEV